MHTLFYFIASVPVFTQPEAASGGLMLVFMMGASAGPPAGLSLSLSLEQPATSSEHLAAPGGTEWPSWLRSARAKLDSEVLAWVLAGSSCSR